MWATTQKFIIHNKPHSKDSLIAEWLTFCSQNLNEQVHSSTFQQDIMFAVIKLTFDFQFSCWEQGNSQNYMQDVSVSVGMKTEWPVQASDYEIPTQHVSVSPPYIHVRLCFLERPHEQSIHHIQEQYPVIGANYLGSL